MAEERWIFFLFSCHRHRIAIRILNEFHLICMHFVSKLPISLAHHNILLLLLLFIVVAVQLLNELHNKINVDDYKCQIALRVLSLCDKFHWGWTPFELRRIKCHSPTYHKYKRVLHSCAEEVIKKKENNWIHRMDLKYYRFSDFRCCCCCLPWCVLSIQLISSWGLLGILLQQLMKPRSSFRLVNRHSCIPIFIRPFFSSSSPIFSTVFTS